jgi:hypothetical protein
VGIEVFRGEDVNTSLLTAGKNQTVRELVAKSCGENHSAFVVELGGVRTQEHGAPLSCPATRRYSPLYSTLLQIQPLLAFFFPAICGSAPPVETKQILGAREKTGPKGRFFDS